MSEREREHSKHRDTEHTQHNTHLHTYIVKKKKGSKTKQHCEQHNNYTIIIIYIIPKLKITAKLRVSFIHC